MAMSTSSSTSLTTCRSRSPSARLSSASPSPLRLCARLVGVAALLVLLLATQPRTAQGRLREGECEVCLRRVGEMTASLGGLKSASAIEDGIKRVCRSYTDKADQRFCYYIGGSDDAATSLLRTLSGAMMNHLPAVKVCEKLKAADGQICAVKYEAPPKAIDWATVDLSKMRVKELKHILDGWGEKCEGCTEKGDFISLIDRVKAQHVPLAAGKGDL